MRKNQKKRAKKRALKNNNNQNKNTKNNAKQPKPQIVYLREPKQKESIFDSLGGLLTKGLSALISGFGDYKVNENSLLTGGIAPPEVVNSVNDGGVIIRHREYLGDIPATIDFTITRYFINPGYTLTFPWLSHIATSFEQYKLRGMIFEFKSLSSDAVLSSATSSALGAVIMATQYDVLDTPFPNKFTMENYLFQIQINLLVLLCILLSVLALKLAYLNFILEAIWFHQMLIKDYTIWVFLVLLHKECRQHLVWLENFGVLMR